MARNPKGKATAKCKLCNWQRIYLDNCQMSPKARAAYGLGMHQIRKHPELRRQ